MSDFRSELEALEAVLGKNRIRKNVELSTMTTFQIGGPADLYYEARSAGELAASIEAARDTGIPFFLLGLGANILIGDLGIRGIVIRNCAQNWELESRTGRLWCETGTIVWPDLILATTDAQCSGLEHFAGIPSTVGGGLWQNLHFLSPPPERERTLFLDEIFLNADILTPTNERKTVEKPYFEFGYDTSVLHHSGDIALSATFQLEHGDREQMKRTIAENLAWRAERHPPLDSEPSAGSIFKKIEGIGAGRLIDSCGLKGTKIGNIEITTRHANIMVNRGGGTARDVRALIALTIETVLQETGYRLEPEIAFIGEFGL